MDPSLVGTEYDAIVVGTGMVEAILAGALARVGRKVLHLDQNDYYGSNYASFPLRQFLQWTRNERAAPRVFDRDSDDEGDRAHAETPPEGADADAGAREPATRCVPVASSLRCHLLEQAFADPETERALLTQSSAFSIDINPRLVLSSEELVETLITSGVGQYLEFTAVQHTYMHLQPPATAAAAAADTVWEVPCSKKDVFQSKLLGMVEKRQLMKFLQFVADYGETHITGEDVGTKNERSLALGRALKRPQNKSNQAGGDAVAPFLDGPFQALLETHFKLSRTLQQVVVYCVGLASFPAAKNQISARDGLAAVYRYVASVGRFTSTALLVPLYGVSELAQSFCRLCAVYGGVYVLRAPVASFLLDAAGRRVVGLRASDGATLCAKHFIVNGSFVDAFGAGSAHGQVLRGVFVLRTSLRRAATRLMVVVPPEDAALRNPFAVQVVQLDAGACVCPRDLFLVQVSMPLPREWLGDRAKQLALVLAVMERLVTSALAETKAAAAAAPASTEDANGDQPPEPTWRDVVAYHAVYTMDHLASTHNSSSVAQKSPHLPANLWPCETRVDGDGAAAGDIPVNPLEIHLESASANARAIFDQLCPGEVFLPKSASAEQAEKEALEDEHGAVLQAAQKLAEQATVRGADVDEPPADDPAPVVAERQHDLEGDAVADSAGTSAT
ncbi:hypothetical protein PybrP1_001886 [[Pythium] brassicae (nom. inval.)]|nr:hypothetical protein PybrP1_001886 [[Pythium] brassicae (nom. inval.)]